MCQVEEEHKFHTKSFRREIVVRPRSTDNAPPAMGTTRRPECVEFCLPALCDGPTRRSLSVPVLCSARSAFRRSSGLFSAGLRPDEAPSLCPSVLTEDVATRVYDDTGSRAWRFHGPKKASNGFQFLPRSIVELHLLFAGVMESSHTSATGPLTFQELFSYFVNFVALVDIELKRKINFYVIICLFISTFSSSLYHIT